MTGVKICTEGECIHRRGAETQRRVAREFTERKGKRINRWVRRGRGGWFEGLTGWLKGGRIPRYRGEAVRFEFQMEDELNSTSGNGSGRDIQEAVGGILRAIGEDPSREGLAQTPERVARMFKDLTSGYQISPEELINGAIFQSTYDEMVVVRDIEFYSLCEHHLLPFFGHCHVAYVPSGRIIGLSKMPRIVDAFSKRLQVQERLTWEIAEFLNLSLKPMGTAVVMEAVHLCTMMRGVRKHDTRMVTSSMVGAFKRDERTRNEFMNFIRPGNGK